jgi:pimeloyl-ACP methyl ester carboxylesterase
MVKTHALLVTAAIALASCSADDPSVVGGAPSTSTDGPSRLTFVLVHGGWGSGDEFNSVAELLRAKGHRVFAPTLTGLGERADLARADTNLSTHIEDIVNVFRSEEIHSAVLLGHSYGGMVITGVADQIPEQIAALVYLDAALPEPGQAAIDVLNPGDALLEEILVARQRGEMALPFPARAAQEFGIPEEELAKIPPHPIGSFSEPIRLTGAYRGVARKTYVASEFQAYRHFYDRVVSDPAWRAVVAPTGHNVHMEAPELTVQILEESVSE